MKTKINREEAGQALVELSMAFVLLCVFVCGIIDLGRAVYDVEVIKNLVGEGSMMALRAGGTDLATTVQTVTTYAGSDINLSTQGCVIITAVTNPCPGGVCQITAQASQCAITAGSKIGCLKGQGGCQSSGAVLPAAAVSALTAEPTGSSLYATEIYYNYSTVTPLAALLGKSMPSQFYSVAYY